LLFARILRPWYARHNGFGVAVGRGKLAEGCVAEER
jgi:hypothetical protein